MFQKCQQGKEQEILHLYAVVTKLKLVVYAIVFAGHIWYGKVLVVIKLLKGKVIYAYPKYIIFKTFLGSSVMLYSWLKFP